MKTMIQAVPSECTIHLTCPLAGCATIVTAHATVCGYGHIADVDASAARLHAAEHTAEESRLNDLIPTLFHCGMPWEHEEHVYGYGPRQRCEIGENGDTREYTVPQEGSWVCPGITWQETAGDTA